MTNDEFLQSIAANAFGAAFQQEICNVYQRNAKADCVDTLEASYREAKAFLTTALSAAQLAQLAAYEDRCKSIREFSARFGFEAGLFCGFQQFFTTNREEDGGFYTHVDNEIASMPNMALHEEHFQNIQQRNALLSALLPEEDEAASAQLTTIDCTWSQRERSASIHGFYCGYLGAMEIIDKVGRSQGGSCAMTDKRSALENYFGYSQVGRNGALNI